ncbi:MAG: hypothetical protein Crog4KO_33930 [Crocinitomicaceae bacterium]
MSPHESYIEIGTLLGTSDTVVMGQMFGKESLKFQNKAFAAFHQESMVFRLGAQQIASIQATYPTAENWDPSGKNRPMKDWLLVPSQFQSDWMALAQKALDQLKSTP